MSRYRLEARGVTKAFPGTWALNQVQLQVQSGEVHVLRNENDAGKSALMNIIGGVLPPTEGEILFKSAPIAPKSPKEARDIGIDFVRQKLSLYSHLTMAENIFIGRLPHEGGMINFERLWAGIDTVLKQSSANFPSSALVSGLTVSEQRIIEITKSVSLNCKLLILDEPTSSFTEKETARLFDLVEELSGRGISIPYISHHIAEIFEIYDRVTMFKDGIHVATMDTGDICADDIVRAMAGCGLGNLYPAEGGCITADDLVLEIDGLTGSIFRGISFALRRGEILGFAGLIGAGQSEVIRGLCATDPICPGRIMLNSRPYAFHTYRGAVDAGICHLTEDRKTQGLFLETSIKNNMSSVNMRGVSHGIWLGDELERSLANRLVEQLVIKTPDVEYLISSLSDGNQQKCLIGKWPSLVPKVIVMDELTHGIDVGTKWEIHALLYQLTESGVSVTVVSSELSEVIDVPDRVAVMHGGCLAGFPKGEKVAGENIMEPTFDGQLTGKELQQ